MGLGKTFTNSIVREIGRNCGKAVSNALLGDKHSTPIRVVRSNEQDVTRKRGRLYQNNFDMAIKKFEIKGAQATFNQVLNIHNEFFSLVDEANADGVIDLHEMSFLIQEIPRGIGKLENAKSALLDLDKKDFADKTEEKINSFKEFIKSLDEALLIDNLPSTKFSPIAFLCFFLSFIGLDRIYFNPKNFWSIFYAIIGIGAPFFYFTLYIEGTTKLEENEFMQGGTLSGNLLLVYFLISSSMPFWYGMILNPLKTGGYWRYRSNKAYQKSLNKLAKNIKKLLKEYITKY
tara:strand:+ start:125 stop:991 length:867 start_codon:yes stop_codon:yes gene_type:complete